MLTTLLNWQLNNQFGWGLVGLNLFAHFANDGEIFPVMGVPVTHDDLRGVDPLRYGAILDAVKRANRHLATLPNAPERAEIDGVVVDPLGNGLESAHSRFHGRRNVGRCIFEDTRTEGAAARSA